jgi:hypothetical protein
MKTNKGSILIGVLLIDLSLLLLQLCDVHMVLEVSVGHTFLGALMSDLTFLGVF